MLKCSKKFPEGKVSWICCCYWAKWDKIPISWKCAIFFITKPNPNYEDNTQWNFSLIFLADVKEVEASCLRERKITDNFFFFNLRYCGVRVDVAPVATKWILPSHISLKKIIHIGTHLLAFIFFMNFRNECVSHRHILYQNVKKGKMGAW